MLTNKNVSNFSLPGEIINLIVVMLGYDFHLLLALNKTVRGQIVNDEIGKKYVFFIPRLLNHYHYSKSGLDQFLRDQHEDPKEKLARLAVIEKQHKEKKSQNIKKIEHKEVMLPPSKKRHLDPEEAYDFHSTYQISDKLRTVLYSSDQEYPSVALRLGLDERYFYGRDYINKPKQLSAIFRLISSGGLSVSQAIERIRGFSALQAQGISWGLSDHAVRTLTAVQLKFLVKIVDINHIDDIAQLLIKHKEIDNELNLQTLYSVMILDDLRAENAFQVLATMSEMQKQQKIYEFDRYNRLIVVQQSRERFAQMFPNVQIRGIDDEQDELQVPAQVTQVAIYVEVKDESKPAAEDKSSPPASVQVNQALVPNEQLPSNLQNTATSLMHPSLTSYSVLPKQQTSNRHGFWQLAEQAAELQVSLFEEDHSVDPDSCAFHLF